MTQEEKIKHLQNAAMEDARAEADSLISNYRAALETVLQTHQEEARRQAETRIKAEATSARLRKNQAAAKAQLEQKRELGKIQQKLKDQVFEEVLAMLKQYTNTASYMKFLEGCIFQAVQFAAGEAIVIYINESDKKLIPTLEKHTGAKLTVSHEDFKGGIRAIIRSRNVLIDHSFKTQLRNEYDAFLFTGGDSIA